MESRDREVNECMKIYQDDFFWDYYQCQLPKFKAADKVFVHDAEFLILERELKLCQNVYRWHYKCLDVSNVCGFCNASPMVFEHQFHQSEKGGLI